MFKMFQSSKKESSNQPEIQSNSVVQENNLLRAKLNIQEMEIQNLRLKIPQAGDENFDEWDKYNQKISSLQKQIQLLQKQNLEHQDTIEVQKREFTNYMNQFNKQSQIDSFDKLPIFSKIQNDIVNKAKIYSQDNQIRSLHLQAEKTEKEYKDLQIRFDEYKVVQDHKLFLIILYLIQQKQIYFIKFNIKIVLNYTQTAKKQNPSIELQESSMIRNLEHQVHNLKSMVAILEHEIKDKIIDIKILTSGSDLTKQQILSCAKSDYKVILKEAKYKYQKTGKSEHVYIKTEAFQDKTYVDEIKISGYSGGYNSYIYMAVYNSQDQPVTAEFIIYRNMEEIPSKQYELQKWQYSVDEGEIINKLQEKGNYLKVYGKSLMQNAVLVIQEIILGLVFLDMGKKG